MTIWAFLFSTLGMELAWALDLPNTALPLLPPNLGLIKEVYAGPNPKTIIYIQDAHSNYSCQKSISSIIGRLNNEYAIDTALLEGGAGDYDISPFTDIKDKRLREKIADYFVKEGRLNGAEFFAINNPEKMTLKGLEEAGLYHKNLAAYRESLKFKEDVDMKLSALDERLSREKENAYPKELKEFEKIRGSYRSGELELDKYLYYLNALSSSLNLDISIYKNISELIAAKEKEEDIDFKKANYERGALIRKLEKHLSRMELETLMGNSVLFKKKELSQTQFHSYLFKKADAVGIDMLKEYPNLCRFKEYIAIFESIDRWILFEEMNNLEEGIVDRLCRDKSQKRLYDLSKHLELLKGLFNISLTPEEYRYYKENKEQFDIKLNDRYIEKTEEFYRYAFERDTAFLNNISSRIKDKEWLIVITGGFHTENLKELLKKEGYSYVIILPKFDPNEKTPYLKLLSGGLSPVEEAVNARKSAVAVGSPVGHLGPEISQEAIDEVEGMVQGKRAISRTSPVEGEIPIVRSWDQVEDIMKDVPSVDYEEVMRAGDSDDVLPVPIYIGKTGKNNFEGIIKTGQIDYEPLGPAAEWSKDPLWALGRATYSISLGHIGIIFKLAGERALTQYGIGVHGITRPEKVVELYDIDTAWLVRVEDKDSFNKEGKAQLVEVAIPGMRKATDVILDSDLPLSEKAAEAKLALKREIWRAISIFMPVWLSDKRDSIRPQSFDPQEVIPSYMGPPLNLVRDAVEAMVSEGQIPNKKDLASQKRKRHLHYEIGEKIKDIRQELFSAISQDEEIQLDRKSALLSDSGPITRVVEILEKLQRSLKPPSTRTSPLDEKLYREIEDELVRKNVPAEYIKRILKAFKDNPREYFVPKELRRSAYRDDPLFIGESQTISQPSLVAYICALLNLSGNERVLEVGAGSGWLAAILGSLVPEGEVYAVEYLEKLYDMARGNIARFDRKNIHLRRDDGAKELFEKEYFDRIVVSASAKEIPSALLNELKVGGHIVIPEAFGTSDLSILKLGTKLNSANDVEWKSIMSVRFVPLVNGSPQSRTSPVDEKILNDEAREKIHEIISKWDAVKEKVRSIEGYNAKMTLEWQMIHTINSARSLIDGYEQLGAMAVGTVQDMIEALNKMIECAEFIKQAIQQHTTIPNRAFVHHGASVLYGAAVASQKKGELKDSHVQELSVLIEEISGLIPDYESLEQILEQIGDGPERDTPQAEGRTSPMEEHRLYSTQEVFGRPRYVLHRYLKHYRELAKAHNVSAEKIKQDMQKWYNNGFGKTAPQDAPREGFIRVLSDEDIQEAVAPLPDFLLKDITYRRYEASDDIFGPGLIYFYEVYPDGELLKGEILIPDIPAGLLYEEAQSWVDSKIFAPSGPLYTEAERMAFCREVYKLAITHEIGEQFSDAMHTSMDIWSNLPERFGRKNKVVEREKVVRGLIIGDPRHEFCDSLMVYFWPGHPLLKNFSLLDAEKRVIAQLLEIASQKPKGAYFVSNHVEKFMERIRGLSIVDRTSANYIYFKSVFDETVLQKAADGAGLILHRTSERPVDIYDGQERCANLQIYKRDIKAKEGFHGLRLKRDISIPSLEKIERFINILAGLPEAPGHTSPMKEVPLPLSPCGEASHPSPLRGEGIESVIKEQFRILTEEVPYRKAQYTIGVVVKARQGDEAEIERCRRYAQEIEQDGRRLGALIGITRGISEEDRASINFIPYIDDGTQSDKNLARLREFNEKMRMEREKNPDGIVFSFMLNGRNVQDAAYTVSLDGEFISGWSQMLLGPLFAVYIHSKLEEIDKTDGENVEATIEAIVKSIEAMKATLDMDLKERLRKVQNKEELAVLFNGSLVLYLPPIAPESQDNLETLRRTERETGAAL